MRTPREQAKRRALRLEVKAKRKRNRLKSWKKRRPR